MSIPQRFTFILLGLLLIYASCALFSAIPQKSDLIWVSSAEVKEVRYSVTQRGVRTLCVTTRDIRCLSLDSRDTGYAELLAAAKNGASYAIGYIEDRELFSDSPERYNMIYAINVGGVSVASFESRVNGMRYLSGFLLAGGILLIGVVVHAFVRKDKAVKGKARAPHEAPPRAVKNIGKMIAYLSALTGYVAFMVAYGKEHLVNALAGLPIHLASLIYVFVGVVPFYVLLLLAFEFL